MKTLQHEFKKEVGIAVSEVFIGGSLGHGTQVPQKYDIDLVLYSQSAQLLPTVYFMHSFPITFYTQSPHSLSPLFFHLITTPTALKDEQDKVVSDGCWEWLDKTTKFLKTSTDGRCSGYDTHMLKDVVVGIKFKYSFYESKEEISVDLFLSPNFSSLEKLLEFLQGLDK